MTSQPKTIQTTKVEDKAPWGPAQPMFLDLYGKTMGALNETNKNPFMGDFLAGPGAATGQGIDALMGAMGKVGQGSGDFLNMATATAKGDYLNPDSNPFIRQVANAAVDPLRQNFTNTVIPAITDQAIAQGAYGGARQDISQERAAETLNRQIGDITSNIFYNNYNAERGRQMEAGNLLGQGYELATARGTGLLGIGDLQQQIAQRALENERMKFMEQKQAPWYGLGEAAQILGTGGFNTVTGTATGPNPNYVDPFTNALKIGLGGLGMLGSIGGQGGFGLWGRR